MPEIVRFSIVGMVWLQMAYTLRSGNHLRTTLLLDRMPNSRSAPCWSLNSLVGIGLFVMIAWLGWIEMVKSFDDRRLRGRAPGAHPGLADLGHPGRRRGAHRDAIRRSNAAVRYISMDPEVRTVRRGTAIMDPVTVGALWFVAIFVLILSASMSASRSR